MLESGQYLIQQFYDNDYDKAMEHPFNKNESLKQLFERLQTESSGNVPKKSWLYNSINLAIAEKQYEELSIYGNLGHSHNIVLAGQKKLPEETKKGLMEKTINNGWPVLRLQKEINKLKKTGDIKLDEELPIKILMALDFQKLNSLRTRTVEHQNKVQEKLARYQRNLTNIDEAIKSKPPEPKRKTKAPNIISVSRRSDIPAFYSDWFFNRVKAGYVQVKGKTRNKSTKKVVLTPEQVRCFVFWTKNPEPMMERLDELKDFYFYFQFTLTPYGKDLEKNLPPKDKLVETFIQLSEKIGQERVIWRYDPILLNDKIDIEYHKTEFTNLAKSLQGHTDKCVISFIDTVYISAEIKKQLKLKKITNEMMKEMGQEFQTIGSEYGIKIETCAEKIDLTEFGITPAKCIDDKIIGTLIGEHISIAKDLSQRKVCGCVESFDIGTYETCLHGCSFCYATKDEAQARVNYGNHDKDSPLLIGKMPVVIKSKKTTTAPEVKA